MSSILFVLLIVGLAMGVILGGSWFLSRGGRWPRLFAILGLVLLGLFSGFGFLATFEPLDAGVAWTWRVSYGGVGMSCLIGAVVLMRSLVTQRKEPVNR